MSDMTEYERKSLELLGQIAANLANIEKMHRRWDACGMPDGRAKIPSAGRRIERIAPGQEIVTVHI